MITDIILTIGGSVSVLLLLYCYVVGGTTGRLLIAGLCAVAMIAFLLYGIRADKPSRPVAILVKCFTVVVALLWILVSWLIVK